MFKIFQIMWDLFMMRRAVRSGQLTLRKGLISFALVFLAYLILVPATVLWEKHPELKPLFVAAVVFCAMDFAFLIGLCLYWWRQSAARQS